LESQELLDPTTPFSSISEKARRRLERKAERRKAQTTVKSFEPRNKNQRILFQALDTFPVVFATGPQGTGKTYVAARHAIRDLLKSSSPTEKIIVTRPNVSNPRYRLGFQPGGLGPKMRPWLVPIFDGFRDETSQGQIDKLTQEGKIEIVPFEFMQGRTFHNCRILLDEAENCTYQDLELVITRTGEDSVLVLSGDSHQAQIEDSGLDAIVQMVADFGLNAAVIEFTVDDVVRSAVAKEWVRAFRLRKAWGEAPQPSFLAPRDVRKLDKTAKVG
jgi:phosphate starvation-inducible protein PhoH and related proteins